MDDATRLCIHADLMMALSPLVGEPNDLLTQMDAAMRATAVVKKYIDDAMVTEGAYRVDHVGDGRFTITVGLDPDLIDALRRALEQARDSLSD